MLATKWYELKSPRLAVCSSQAAVFLCESESPDSHLTGTHLGRQCSVTGVCSFADGHIQRAPSVKTGRGTEPQPSVTPRLEVAGFSWLVLQAQPVHS